MRIKTIIAGAAIVMAATIGSAPADDQFSTLEGVTAVAMSSGELDAVAGTSIHFFTPSGRHTTGEPPPGHKFHHTGRGGADDCGGGDCPGMAVSYNGLQVAECVAVGISGLGPSLC